MSKQIIITENAPAPVGPYNQAIKAGNFLFVSGQIAIDPATNQLFSGSLEDETRLVFKNLKGVLDAAGYDFKDVVKATVFLSDMGLFAKVNEIYAEYFTENPPARECVAVKTLPKNVNVEISVIAYAE
ncbi:reactive intermediate/imine deaminase [Arachidicoccus ginsenosidimutans]|uniref:RidA family protein n=1 Tax=Arachidicoccus sp. BS20 TaxID=1850526 RepID=UPI0007F08BBD|nr:RidA family protein [Arachidicoccus sp. BS20]ANI89351.1 reactive intermediate/imine deaminase [Arachidicoccus sp. BS20]